MSLLDSDTHWCIHFGRVGLQQVWWHEGLIAELQGRGSHTFSINES